MMVKKAGNDGMKEKLRSGYTTGTCAALATAAAATLLLAGERQDAVSLMTPKGIRITCAPEELYLDGETARCAIRKDAGDDPDVTDGILIRSAVRKAEQGIRIDGGEGIGRVTKPGLDQPVGAAAINSVPRQMIRSAAEEVCAGLGYPGGLEIVISALDGERIAKKTFNPMLGIEGGISILGTSGIVEPMSEQALLDTIAVEAHQIAVIHGTENLILAPGNYGTDFLRSAYPGLRSLPVLKCSNYLGDALEIAGDEGFQSVLLIGHIGKLVKLAGGIFNTHSRVADCRIELFCAHAAICGASTETCQRLMEQVTTDGCLAMLRERGLQEAVMQSLLHAVQERLERKCSGAYRVGALTFSNEYGLLGMTEEAKRILEEWEENARSFSEESAKQ